MLSIPSTISSKQSVSKLIKPEKLNKDSSMMHERNYEDFFGNNRMKMRRQKNKLENTFMKNKKIFFSYRR